MSIHFDSTVQKLIDLGLLNGTQSQFPDDVATNLISYRNGDFFFRFKFDVTRNVVVSVVLIGVTIYYRPYGGTFDEVSEPIKQNFPGMLGNSNSCDDLLLTLLANMAIYKAIEEDDNQ